MRRRKLWEPLSLATVIVLLPCQDAFVVTVPSLQQRRRRPIGLTTSSKTAMPLAMDRSRRCWALSSSSSKDTDNQDENRSSSNGNRNKKTDKNGGNKRSNNKRSYTSSNVNNRGSNNNNSSSRRKKKGSKGTKLYYSRQNNQSQQEIKDKKKKEMVARTAQELRKVSGADQKDDKDDASLLDIVNPFRAGQKLRETIQSLTGISDEKRSIYLDDRLGVGGGLSLNERNPLLARQQGGGYIPEVLVVGATGAVGRLVVQQLLLNGNCRVRVLVRDLYSRTLNLLGTGVTYCQGDLNNIESLEYAVTDVDKIVFCAGAPKPDETDFSNKFQDYTQETLGSSSCGIGETSDAGAGANDVDGDWEHLETTIKVRAKLAEQVDCIGMQNLVRAYQDVRHADYGTPQTAKRSLFNFKTRDEDFQLFALEEDEEDDNDGDVDAEEIIDGGGGSIGRDEDLESSSLGAFSSFEYDEREEYYEKLAAEFDEIDDEDDDDEHYDTEAQVRSSKTATRIQCAWMKNKIGNAVFVGKVSKNNGESAIVSSRLRSRDEPEEGLDLSNGFGGFIARVCTDGSRYEAFVRTSAYETYGIEYVCEFGTKSKQVDGNKSPNKFSTVRLGFDMFQPIQRKRSTEEAVEIPTFRGRDIRQIGFRYRASVNEDKNKREENYSSFYMALMYIKVFRSTPEPEFVYLSDARIPPKVSNGMVRHEHKQLLLTGNTGVVGEPSEVSVLDGVDLNLVVVHEEGGRTAEETYFKYRGEEILKGSGLNYAIVRVAGYNDLTSGETSAIELVSSNEGVLTEVSRADVAQVCARALLDPKALNKSFYMNRKSKATAFDEDIGSKFALLPPDPS